MFVKNTGDKTIGFGTLILLPGDSNELPAGYDQKHPTVKFYIQRGWLTPTVTESQTPVVTEPTEEERLAAEEQARKDAEAQTAADLAAKIKALSTLNLEPLRALATELGIEFTPTDTKDVLKQKITEKYQAE